MTHAELLTWLRETDPEHLNVLWNTADRVRRENVGDAVHLRGLIEISNHCRRGCLYCGLRCGNRALTRYRMTPDEILECARRANELNYGTVVLQAGEDPGLTRDMIAELVWAIKRETPLAVTLSLGERSPDELAAWRRAGADRYLLRFETSNRALYRTLHPPLHDTRRDRLTLLRMVQTLGYEAGSGVMIGLPGQTYGDLAADLEVFRALQLDMIGVGPYIAHPDTPLAGKAEELMASPREQVSPDELMTYKMIALARIVRPNANIPSTTALATLNPKTGRELGLMRGANVVMPNITPQRYRAQYEIYPGKVCLTEEPEDCNGCIRARIQLIGRTVGTGPGHARDNATAQEVSS